MPVLTAVKWIFSECTEIVLKTMLDMVHPGSVWNIPAAARPCLSATEHSLGSRAAGMEGRAPTTRAITTAAEATAWHSTSNTSWGLVSEVLRKCDGNGWNTIGCSPLTKDTTTTVCDEEPFLASGLMDDVRYFLATSMVRRPDPELWAGACCQAGPVEKTRAQHLTGGRPAVPMWWWGRLTGPLAIPKNWCNDQ